MLTRHIETTLLEASSKSTVGPLRTNKVALLDILVSTPGYKESDERAENTMCLVTSELARDIDKAIFTGMGKIFGHDSYHQGTTTRSGQSGRC